MHATPQEHLLFFMPKIRHFTVMRQFLQMNIFQTFLIPLQALFVHLYLQAFHGKHHSIQCVHVCNFLLDIHHLLCHTSIAFDTPHSLSPTSHCGLSKPEFVFKIHD